MGNNYELLSGWMVMSVDENNAYRITERLSFPRLVGSEGEQKAIKVVVDEFEKAGLEVKRESFETSFFSWTMARYIFFPLRKNALHLCPFKSLFLL